MKNIENEKDNLSSQSKHLPTVKEMIAKIYEVVADKTFKYWLNIIRNNMSKEKVVCIKALADWRFRLETFAPSSFNHYWIFISLSELEDIIAVWHDVMIWDILKYLQVVDRYLWYIRWTDEDDKIVDKLLFDWKDLSKPIDIQPDHCIRLVYEAVYDKQV